MWWCKCFEWWYGNTFIIILNYNNSANNAVQIKNKGGQTSGVDSNPGSQNQKDIKKSTQHLVFNRN